MLVVLTQRDKRVDTPGSGGPLRHRNRQHGSSRHEDARRQPLRHHHGCFARSRRRVHSVRTVPAREDQAVPDEKEDENSVDFQALRRTVVSQFERIIKLSPQLPDDLQTIVINIEDASRLADYIATNLPNLSIVSKQFVLEQTSVRKRLEFLNTELAKELEVLELRSKIQNQVQEEVGKSQREYFLARAAARDPARTW